MHKWLSLGLLSVGLMGCERVVSVTAPRGEIRLVVEAKLERAIGAVAADQQIRLTTTQDVFSNGPAPAARGATVRVVDDRGVVTPFTERSTDPGLFQASGMVLPVGRRYTLQITWNDDSYASTETMLSGVPMDSLFFSPDQISRSGSQSLRATVAARDPVDQVNFYLWDQWIDNRRLVSPDSEFYSRVVVDDELLNGGRVRGFQPYDFAVRSGQLVRVRQLSIPERVYDFFRVLSLQTSSDGSPFGVPASNVRGNVANLTSPSRVALGYFMAGEYAEIERRVP